MIFLFTRKNTIFSKLIRFFTGEDISHFVIYFPEYEIVFHSFRKGVEIDWFERFKKNYEIIYKLILRTDKTKEALFYTKIISEYIGKPYDLGALLFNSVIIMAKRWFGYVYERNLWGSKNAFLCTELIEAVKELGIINDIEWPKNIDILTPKQLYEILKTSKDITDDTESTDYLER